MVLGAPGLGVLSAADRLAVWGDPIAHSRSPRLHAAAYAVLGLDWSYERRRVDAGGFPGALASLDGTWRGLSLTYPLKSAAFAASVEHDRRAALTRAVNTLLLTPGGPRGFNTDVGGIVRMLRDEAIDRPDRARIIGAGATATSALVALSELGTRHVEVVLRRPEAGLPLIALGDELGLAVETVPIPTDTTPQMVPLTIATLPGEASLADAAADRLADAGGVLVDVVYGTWPTPLADAWARHGAIAHSGLGMLLHQAVLQVRIFVAGDVASPLPDEDLVVAAMRRAVVGD